MKQKLLLPQPHSEGQKSVILSRGNDCVFAGRRYGKTHMACTRIIMAAQENPGLYWWVGLGWKSASLKRAWRQLKQYTDIHWRLLGEKPEKHIRESAKEVDLPGGSEIWMRTAERPDSLAGEGIKGCVLDEFTLMREAVWTEYVEATLLDYNGWALFIGVPKGNNWGAKLWKNCPNRPGWKNWHFSTLDNPQISPERLEDIGKNIPYSLFQQEYLAEIINGAGLAFKNIHACYGSRWLEGPEKDKLYCFGLDWGKKDDFTVVTVMDLDAKEVVNISRFNDLDYPTQLSKVRELYLKFLPRCIIAESNAMGDPLCDQLLQDGLPIKPFFTTNSSKREIIEALAVGFEQAYIKIPDEDLQRQHIGYKAELTKELEEYEMELTQLGNVKYHAPEGGHDDLVMSLALAWNEARYDTGISF